MKQLLPTFSICLILIVLNGVYDSFCRSVSGGALRAKTASELPDDFDELGRILAGGIYLERDLHNFHIKMTIRQCSCLRKAVILSTIDLWFDAWMNSDKSGLDFVLMGDCLPGCQTLSIYGYLRTPTLVSGCMAQFFSDKTVFPFVMRLTGTWEKMGQPFYEFMRNFGWKKVAIVFSYRDLINTGAMEIRRFLQSQQMTVYECEIDDYNSFTQPINLHRMTEAARNVKGKTGILLLMMNQDDRLLFLRVAKDLHMLDGTYAFLTIYNFDNSSKEAIELQEGIVILNYVDSRTTSRALDGIELYVRAKNQTDDPDQIMALMRNDSFQGLSGLIMFDDRGVRLDRYAVTNIRNGKPEQVMQLSHDPVSKEMKVDFVNLSGMIWPGGASKTPKDTIISKSWMPDYLVFYLPLIAIGYTIFIIFFFLAYRVLSYGVMLKASSKWIIDWEEIRFEDDSKKMYDDATSLTSDRISYMADRRLSRRSRPSELTCIEAIYANNPVLVQTLFCTSIKMKNRKILKEVNLTMSLSHENIVRYIGICPSEPHAAIVMSVAKRGSLQDIIMRSDEHGSSNVLDLDFVVSLLIDAAKGMQYLHSTDIGSHGHLTSAKCVIDSRWTCQIAGCGFRRLKKCRQNYSLPESQRDDVYFRGLSWTAPEILRQSLDKRPIYGTKEGDVYSFAIICQEAAYSDIPFAKESTVMQFKDIVNEVRKKSISPFRPSLAYADCSREFIDFICSCWHEVPSKRPSFQKIVVELQKLFESSGEAHVGLMEKLMIRTEKHALSLVDQVEEATAELITEKKKADDLLNALLPRYVAEILERGKTFEPQEYETISMCFADIVEFTKIAAASTPMQVVQLLSSIYSKYDDITDAHNAYKIETIGDSYVVASGVPVRNGQQHAVDIADLALDLLRTIETSTIPYLNGIPLLTRIGIHTGPVVAGVVGVKVPRLNVFGLTVIIASKLEATGARNKIHISSSTAAILRTKKRYILEYRGEKEITRGNFIETYFLLGYKDRKKSKDGTKSRKDSQQLDKHRKALKRKSSEKKNQETTTTTTPIATTTTTTKANADVLKKADDIWRSIYKRIVGDVDKVTPLLRSSNESKRQTVASFAAGGAGAGAAAGLISPIDSSGLTVVSPYRISNLPKQISERRSSVVAVADRAARESKIKTNKERMSHGPSVT